MKYSRQIHGDIVGGTLKNDIVLRNHYGQPAIPAGAEVEAHDDTMDGEEYVLLSFSINYTYKGEKKRKLFMVDSSNLPNGFMTAKQYEKYCDDSLSEVFYVSLELYINDIRPNLK